MHNRRPPPKSEQPALAVDSAHLDFGEVWETDKLEWTFPVTNRESQSVELTELRGSCNCGMPEVLSGSIPPGGIGQVRLTLDLRPKSFDNTNAPSRRFETTVQGTVKTGSGAGTPVSWKVGGTVKRLFRSLPAVEFGPHSELTLPIPPRVVPLESAVALESLTAESSVPHFRADVRRNFSDPSRYELVVTPIPPARRWSGSGTVTLIPVGSGGQPLPKASLSVSATVVPDVEAIPERVSFGAREPGTEVAEVVSLRSLAERPFVVERAEADGAGVSAVVGADGRSCVVRVNVSGVGPLTGSVRLRVRSKDNEPFELVVPVQAHGFLP